MSVATWHTFPLKEETEEEDGARVFEDDVPFYSQLRADEYILKNNVDLLARLLEAKRWTAPGTEERTNAFDLGIVQEYERVYKITLSAAQKRSHRNVYTYIARLMTPPEIAEVLFSVSDDAAFRESFFRNKSSSQGRPPMDRAGLTSYVEHASRGGPPEKDSIHRGSVRRVPASTKVYSMRTRPLDHGLDPTRHWGTEVEFDTSGGGSVVRELMACCATPARGQGSIPGCWFQLDKSKALGLIVPYRVLSQVDPWQELSLHVLQPNDRLKELFLADVSTGTAFLDKDHHVQLDTQIRRRWATLVPQLVDYYGQYMAQLDDAIQNGHSKPRDPSSAIVSPAFFEQAAHLGRLIYQYNKPQEQDDHAYLDAKTFINENLFKVPSALVHFNDVTRGFVVIDGVRLTLLNGSDRVIAEWLAFLPTIQPPALRNVLTQGVNVFARAITRDTQSFAARHAEIMPVASSVEGGREVHAAYEEFHSKKKQLQVSLNTAVKQIGSTFVAAATTNVRDATTALEQAVVRLAAAFDDIPQALLDVALAKKNVAEGKTAGGGGASNETVRLLERLEADVGQVLREKRTAISVAEASAGAEMGEDDKEQIRQIRTQLQQLESEAKALVLAAAGDKLLLQALTDKPAGLAVVTQSVTANRIRPLVEKLKELKAVDVDDVTAQVLVHANQTRQEKAERARVLEERKQREAEAEATAAQRRQASAVQTLTWLSGSSVDVFMANSRIGLADFETLFAGIPLSAQESALLRASKILLPDGSLPNRFDTRLTDLPETAAYRGMYFGGGGEREVRNTWKAFADWLLYRGTSKAADKRSALDAALQTYVPIVPVQPVQLERGVVVTAPLTPASATDVSKLVAPASGHMFHTNTLKWDDNSCWMDSTFMALFGYVRNPLVMEILQATKGQHLVRRVTFEDGQSIVLSNCTDAELSSLHSSIKQDILQIGGAHSSSGACPLVSRAKWGDCVLDKLPAAGSHNFDTAVFDSLKVLYDLKTLAILPRPSNELVAERPPGSFFAVKTPRPSNDNVFMHATYTGYSVDTREVGCLVDAEKQSDTFVLGAIVCGSGGHFVVYLYDFRARVWWLFDLGKHSTVIKSVGPNLPPNVHLFQPQGDLDAPTYKPSIYVHYRRSAIQDLLRQQTAGGYEPFASALAQENANELQRLMNDQSLDPVVRANMDSIFRELDLVADAQPRLAELESALRSENSARATEIMTAPIQNRTEIGDMLDELGLLQ